MAPKPSRTNELRSFLIANVRQHPGDVTALATSTFGMSREWVTRVLGRLVREGLLQKEGKTKGIRYSVVEVQRHKVFEIGPDTEEDALWSDFAEPLMADVPANVKEICFYGFTEMVNNVIDHSESSRVSLAITKSADRIQLNVWDLGVGIFVKIKRVLGLDTTRHAVFELSKGKFTTDSSRHTGEGVFFTSRAFDHFSILSSSLWFAHSRGKEDWLLEDTVAEDKKGTSISMEISPTSTYTLDEVFRNQSSDADEVGFNKTRLVLKLAQYADGPLISRSQAKRVLAGMFRFREVLIDFTAVDSIGPAFADEVFRVYRLAHPDILIIPVNMNERCTRMVSRAESHTQP